MVINWINVLKGIGIILVVLGHLLVEDYPGVKQYIFMFHMPLFFFISGYLFKPDSNFRSYFIKKFFAFGIPYLSFLVILFFIPSILLEVRNEQLTLKSLINVLLHGVIGGRYLGGFATVFWFITVLFITQQIMNFMVNWFNEKIILIIVTACLIFAYANSVFFPKFWLPLNINVVAMSLPIFFIGYKFKAYDNYPFLIHISILLSTLGSLLIAFGVNNFFDMKLAFYGVPILTLVSAIATTIILVSISKKLSFIQVMSLPLIELGKASMIIMFLHQFILLTMRDLMGQGHNSLKFTLAIVISYAAYRFFEIYPLTRVALLGKRT